ncbi:MAG TPA: rod shape-determining protein MreC [Gemmatimonadales bacterium]
MALRAESFATRADMAACLLCVVLSLAALALPEGLRVPIASSLRGTALAPLLGVERSTERAAENRARIDLLRAQRDSLALGAAELPQLEAENARLRGLLGLGARLGTGFVDGEVLHQAGVTDGLTLVLSVGSGDGVRPLAPVVAPDGLVGLVRTVDRRTSVALAWTHPDFRVSAMVEHEQVFGIVAARRGEREGEIMELRGVAYRDQLPAGTRVVTSGLGGVFPRGIPIGTVQGVLSESSGWERTYLLKPAVHPAQASHVMVLFEARTADTLSRAFRPFTADSDSAAPPAASRVRPPRHLLRGPS